jgi:hypothetical protein
MNNKFWAAPEGAPHFLPQILHTRSPTAPIWNIVLWLILIRKKYHCNKMKENGWVVGVLSTWGLSHFPMEITTLGFTCTARKAIHIKLGTCSGSSQCQLHFGTTMVSIGWSGCEWLPSECKNAHFQIFPPLTPSANFLTSFLSIMRSAQYALQIRWRIFYGMGESWQI